jgi:hypothetical protein
MVHLEIKHGCWAAPHQYGTAPFSMNLMPFPHREIFDGVLSLPTEYRRRQRLAWDIISATWPELLEFPFNDYTGPRLWMHKMWRKIRK